MLCKQLSIEDDAMLMHQREDHNAPGSMHEECRYAHEQLCLLTSDFYFVPAKSTMSELAKAGK